MNALGTVIQHCTSQTAAVKFRHPHFCEQLDFSSTQRDRVFDMHRNDEFTNRETVYYILQDKLFSSLVTEKGLLSGNQHRVLK